MLIEKQTKLKKEEVYEWFGNKIEFEKYHLQKQAMENGQNMFIEDD